MLMLIMMTTKQAQVVAAMFDCACKELRGAFMKKNENLFRL